MRTNDPAPADDEILFGALAIDDPDERAAYLGRRCTGDLARRTRLEGMLANADRAKDFLSAPLFRRQDANEEQNGDVIGRYRLRGKIGEGGCGVVYLAEQTEPIQRKVALKVIKLGMDTKAVVARFEAERQALAMMDHPNIAKVLDGGATSAGRPYFVMELFLGVPVTRFCDEHGLSLKDRLQLFIRICQAIQHAHQKGVIHRDIKPSNILVAFREAIPEPKVIDFGIAKATTGTPTENTFTALGQFVGTPAYMSPEQLEGKAPDVDTRSDIYSLGVLLYELLTGRTPFASNAVAGVGLDEFLRTIREVDPPRPSNRLNMLAPHDREAVARLRSAAPAQLATQLRGDLDWIVVKALEKQPARRYNTANELAADVQRHLDNDPVQARPPSSLYRFGRTVRRNRLLFGAIFTVSLTLLGALGISTTLYFRERTEHQRAVLAEARQSELLAHADKLRVEAQTNERKAIAEAELSAQTARFMREMLGRVGSGVARGRDTTLLRDILDDTVKRLNSGELTALPEVEASLRRTLAHVFGELHDHEGAASMHRVVVALERKSHGGGDRAVAEALGALATALERVRQFADAEANIREAIAIREKLNDPIFRELDLLAGVYTSAGRLADAEALWRMAIHAERQRSGGDTRAVASALEKLALCINQQGRPAEAESLLHEALAVIQLFGRRDGRPELEAAQIWRSLAQVFRAQHRYFPATAAAREALATRRYFFGTEHHELIGDHEVLARALFDEGNTVEGSTMRREQIALLRKIRGSDHPDTLRALYAFIEELIESNRPAEAHPPAEEALEIARRMKSPSEMAAGAMWLARALEKEGRFSEAEARWREALGHLRMTPGGADRNHALALERLSALLRKTGRSPDADRLDGEWRAVVEKAGLSDTPAQASHSSRLVISPDSKTPILQPAELRDSARVDLVKILSIEPRASVAGERQTFTVHVQYSLVSQPKGLIQLGANTERQTSQKMGAGTKVDAGKGELALTIDLVPIRWNGSPPFNISVILSPDPHPPQWRPLASNRLVVPLK